MQKLQHYVNHIALVVDRSGSMQGLEKQVVTVFDRELENLKKRSVELDQETRVSIYLFDSYDSIECLVFDMDVMRMKSLRDHYAVRNQTALMDATGKAIEDSRRLPELYGDHAFLLYVLTDGEENNSRRYTHTSLKSLIDGLPDNWTVVCMVPNAQGVHEAKRFGFPKDNVQIWDTSARGIEDAGRNFSGAMDNYMTMRAKGVRSTKSFFTVDAAQVTQKQVATALDELAASDYLLLNVPKDSVIAPFVESWTKTPYRKGSAYYQLVKAETVQSHKQICIQNKRNGKVYTGAAARKMLGLPDYELRVHPGDYGDWNVFVQSTSMNRKLPGGTLLLVLN